MARVGLLSDSHGNWQMTREAVNWLLEGNVDLLLHLGDVGTQQVIDQLVVQTNGAGQPVESRLVFGNCDDVEDLEDYAQSLGILVDHPVGKLTFSDRTLVYTHGHYRQAMQQALDGGAAWLCYGHSHQCEDKRSGHTRIINPGALHRAAEYTVAILDTETDEVVFHTLSRD